ncbi:arylamine N-acetyltransferase [Streptomyces sp. PCS3-D2]|uniref:arylamine N-acetyltransferase family protein n=1 Tax=Streptomyces sp. PCS3-D2 TaxID=1460244 RepID=UPI000447F67F|nr:arylamine N-acetyltransferase [Streptomyces sp. PCS3-D2]WKV74356.1 arylamine N-acetyltransferase [Streptomyces sp. PCS3-D2]
MEALDDARTDARTDAGTDAYLRRLGVARSEGVRSGSLRELHLRHLRTVPFENLAIHLGEEIVLTPDALHDKIVTAGRGGICYELNGAFAELLSALGHRVELLQARVHGKDGVLGVPYDHLALRVDGRWLADVGFGEHSAYPLDLEERGEQQDPGGVFLVRAAAGDAAVGDLDVLRDGVPAYRLEARPRALADFRTGAWWHATSPESGFTRGPVCSRLTEDGGRITLRDRTLISTSADGDRTEVELATEGEVLAAYRAEFGIVLDRLPVALHPRD